MSDHTDLSPCLDGCEWSPPHTFHRASGYPPFPITVQACERCGGTRVDMPNGIDAYTELGLVADEREVSAGVRHLRIVPPLEEDDS